jgi:hypothetical protein
MLAMCRTEEIAKTKAIMSVLFYQSNTSLLIPEDNSLMARGVLGV